MATESRTRARRQFDSTSVTTTLETERTEDTEQSTEESVRNSMEAEDTRVQVFDNMSAGAENMVGVYRYLNQAFGQSEYH